MGALSVTDWVAIGLSAQIGIATLVLAGYLFRETRNFVENGVTTVGTVDRWVLRDSDGDAGPLQHAVVRFRSQSGMQVEFESSMGHSRVGYGKGWEVPVIYRAERPAEAEIKLFWRIWGRPVVAGGIGVFSLLFAFFWLAARSRLLPDVGPAAMFLLIGAGFVVAAVLIFRSSRNMQTAIGEVVGAQESPVSPDPIKLLVGHSAALIRFRNLAGKEIEFVAAERESGQSYRMGEQVTVYYDPARFGSARATRPAGRDRIAILTGILGIALIAFSLWMSDR